MKNTSVSFRLAFVCTLLCGLAFGVRNNHAELDRVVAAAAPGKVIIFDLDDTLFDVGPRQFGVLQDFLKLPETQSQFPALAKQALSQLKESDMGYAKASANLGMTGIRSGDPTTDAFLKAADAYWFKAFFSPDALKYDRAQEGAVGFVNDCYNKGAAIVYLSGRKEATRDQTEETLRNAGFPVNAQAKVILKNGTFASDATYKVAMLPQIEQIGQIVAFFDNEPANDLAMKDANPSMDVIFLNTNWEGAQMETLVNRPDIYWVINFNR